MWWSRADVAEGPGGRGSRGRGSGGRGRSVATEHAWPRRFHVEDHIERPLVKW